nr:sensor histidine kinase [uncultured Oscillibacter sp.]
MSRVARPSFRRRLFAGFLAASLIPLLACSAMLLQIFRLRLAADAERETAEQLDLVSRSLDGAFDAFSQAAGRLRGNPIIARALAGEAGEDTLVNNELFNAAGEARSYGSFALYDLQGARRYSTRRDPLEEQLSPEWGALYAAPEGGVRFTACEDAGSSGGPLLRGAARLSDGMGRPVGYLLISMYYDDFRQLLEGKYGARNELIVLSPYWRPVYCAQPSLAESLAPRLRSRLLAGRGLDDSEEGFQYAAARHEASGLCLILQRPRTFTGETMRLLYTVSFGCAVVCVALSVLMSFKLSRQMFRPIQRLRQGFGEVGHNNLDICVPAEREDELGELARRFNEMVEALKRNQEALVANQRELNQAQIRMLQAQLNPHFLCNTLDTMKWISKINKVPQVAVMSTNLADILRFCISPEEFVPLGREAEILERYIEIQKIRMSGAFSFRVDLPEELRDCLIPKMILQPLVENAVLHGLEGVENGAVEVTAREEAGMLRITVRDNGSGLPPELAVGRYRSRGGKHLGLYNVNTILTKYYGDGCGLFLENERSGAAVTAALPIRREEEETC